MRQFLRAKRVAIFSLCLAGLTIPTGLSPIPPGWAQTEVSSIAQANPTDLKMYARQIVEWLGTQQYEKARSALSPQLQPLWSAEKIQQRWQTQVIDYTGPYKQILKVKVIDAINAKLAIVTTQFEKVTEDVILTFNASGQVIAADFPESRTVEEIADAFVESLVKKDYATARSFLSPLLKAEVFPTRVQSGWESLLKRTGAFQRIVGTQVRRGSDTDGLNLVLVTIQFEKLTDTVIFVFDDRKGIVNVDFPLGD